LEHENKYYQNARSTTHKKRIAQCLPFLSVWYKHNTYLVNREACAVFCEISLAVTFTLFDMALLVLVVVAVVALLEHDKDSLY
jgi:hypothetical protein